MVDGPVGALLTWWARWEQRRARRPDRPAAHRAGGAPGGRTGGPAATRLVGAPQPVTRVAVVRPGTLVLRRPVGGDPAVLAPGTLLLPRVGPGAPDVAVPLGTGPVELVLTLTGLVSADGELLPPARVRLTVQVDGRYGAGVLAARLPADDNRLEDALLAALHREVLAVASDAAAANQAVHLRGASLVRLLGGGGLPPCWLGGALRHLGLAADDLPHSPADDTGAAPGTRYGREEDEPTVPIPIRADRSGP